METIFFDGFDDWLRILINIPIIYFAIIAFVRVSGKRSTSQMNNFDWIVTVTMGSISASGIILKNVTLSEALLCIGLLLLLQYVVTKAVFTSETVEDIVKAKPCLLFDNGHFLMEAMRRERVSESEVLASIRGHGIPTIDDVAWVILETDASLSVIKKSAVTVPQAASALKNVSRFSVEPS